MILQIIIEAAQVLVGFLLTRGVDDEIPAKTRETLEKLDRVLWRLLVQLLADGHPGGFMTIFPQKQEKH